MYQDAELPAAQQVETYLREVYKDIPFRTKKEVREEFERKARSLKRGVCALLFFIFIIPVLIEIISLGFDWLGWVLSLVSIAVGIFKAAKAFGYLKQSRREKDEAIKLGKMRHYYLHCEANPEAFNRLKFENLEKDLISKTRAEAKRLKEKKQLR